jgi:hypothetical protein
MATRTIPAITQVTDDFTGKDLTAEDSPVKATVTIKVNGKTKTAELDTASAMANMLMVFLGEPTDENRRKIGDRIPRNRVGGNTAGKPAETDAAGIGKREWLRKAGFKKADGQPIGDRGKLTPEQDEAWAKHMAAEKPASNEKPAA